MKHDTNPDITPPAEAAAKKQLYVAAASLLTALGVAIPALVQSCQNRDATSEVKQDVKETRQEAVEAKVVAGAGYQATKEKLDPTSEEVVQLRKDVNAIKADLAAEKAKREQRAGRRAKATPPPPDPVAPEVSKPLPASPAAAAATQTQPVPTTGGQ
jgi:hypothetical protein